jgi:hypothetical protein
MNLWDDYEPDPEGRRSDWTIAIIIGVVVGLALALIVAGTL